MNFSGSWLTAGRTRRAIANALVCGLFLSQTSCIPELRKPQPAPPLPNSFDGPASEESSSQVRIEDFFNDPMLTGLIHQAVAGNQELRIRNEGIQVASNEALARSGAYLPFVTLGGGAGLSKISSFTPEGAGIRDDAFRPGQFLPNPLPNFIFGANFWWQLDYLRQLRNARDAAVQRSIAATEERNFFVTRLVAEIAANYYELIALDKRIENLDNIIVLLERSLEIARAKYAAARGSDLPVQRFQADVRRIQSQKLIVYQDIVRVENRINFLAGRFPQPVARMSRESIDEFINLKVHELGLGAPPQLLLDRPDIREAERELGATGLDVKVARANFFPKLVISNGAGYQAFNPKYLLLTPEALIYNVVGDVVGPLINFRAIRAEYMTANARQLQAIYNYQRALIDAVTQVITRMSQVQKYGRSIEIKKQQVEALVRAVQDATDLYMNPRIEVAIDYLDVLTAQNALFEARRDLIDTKQEQLSAIVNTYQALGGGAYLSPTIALDAIRPYPRWKHFRHPEAWKTAMGGSRPLPLPPPPPPPPMEIGPPAPPESGPRPLAPPPTESSPFQPPSTPPESDPGPAPTSPTPTRRPIPLPTPMGDGTSAGAASSPNVPPR